MALTPSNFFPKGKKAPPFKLPNVVTDKPVTLDELKGQNATVIMFICNHCPFVVHINLELVRLANDYLPKGVNFIAISSNDAVTYPEDGPHLMKQVAQKLNYPFPYLYDETQAVAKSYEAACTPDLYLFDENLANIYHGQLDDARPGNQIPVTGADIRLHLDALLKGETLEVAQKPSVGCNIKWKE